MLQSLHKRCEAVGAAASDVGPLSYSMWTMRILDPHLQLQIPLIRMRHTVMSSCLIHPSANIKTCCTT